MRRIEASAGVVRAFMPPVSIEMAAPVPGIMLNGYGLHRFPVRHPTRSKVTALLANSPD